MIDINVEFIWENVSPPRGYLIQRRHENISTWTEPFYVEQIHPSFNMVRQRWRFTGIAKEQLPKSQEILQQILVPSFPLNALASMSGQAYSMAAMYQAFPNWYLGNPK